jgi:hypothetical protein
MINIRDLIVNQGFAKAILGGGAAEPPEIKLQEKTITENGEYTADDGFDGLLKVLVDVAGSGGGSAKIAKGKTPSSAQSSAVTIEHGLGVVPDLVLVYSSYTSAYSYLIMAIGVSEAMQTLIGFKVNSSVYRNSSGKAEVNTDNSSNSIEYTGSVAPINSATDTTFKIAASSTAKIYSNSYWVAIGGLT